MAQGAQQTAQELMRALRQRIASVISDEKSYDVPAVCRRYGLADGDGSEAFQSKFKYVQRRLQPLTTSQVVDVARRLSADVSDFQMAEALAKVDERNQHRITELTRRRLVAELQRINIAGELPLMDFLGRLYSLDRMPGAYYEGKTLAYEIVRHCLNNDDWDNKTLLEALGIYSCSQALLFRLLEAIVDPMIRAENEQEEIASRINEHLARDGFGLFESGTISGSRYSATEPRPRWRHYDSPDAA